VGISSSKPTLERFGILFIDRANSHDFIVVEWSQLALFSHREIRLLQWRSHISWGFHHYLVAVNRAPSLLIITSEVILRFLIISNKTGAVLLLWVHWFLSWDHMVRSVGSRASGKTVDGIISSCSALNNALKSLVAVLKTTLLLLINSFDLGCELLLLVLMVTVGARVGSATSLLFFTAWSSVIWSSWTFVVGTSERFMACWWSRIAVSFIPVMSLAELLEHMHEKTLHTLHAVTWLVFSVLRRCSRLLWSLPMWVLSTVHMVMRRRIHAHWWRHETVKIRIKWWISVTRMMLLLWIVRLTLMEGTHSSVPEAAVALFLGCFHVYHTLLLRSFLIVLFLLCGWCNRRLVGILKLLLTLFAFERLILASLTILFGILVNYDVIGDIVDVVGTIAVLLTEWLHIWGVRRCWRIPLQDFTGRDYVVMFVSQVLVNYFIFWINHRILLLSVVLVGCAEIANGEHGHSLLLWKVESMNFSLVTFLSQVHHCIITILAGMKDIFVILFGRVVIQMWVLLLSTVFKCPLIFT